MPRLITRKVSRTYKKSAGSKKRKFSSFESTRETAKKTHKKTKT